MKHVIGVLLMFTCSVSLLVLPVQAQQPQQGPPARPDTMPMMMPPMMGMMQGMMPQQMMQDPMHRAGMMAYAMPALADTLELSEEQRETLQERKQQFVDQQEGQRQKMRAQQKQLRALFEDAAQPGPAAVREQLQALADLRVEQQAARYEAVLQMRDVLTDAQQEALDQMDPRALHRQMMAHMTVMDMMQMMRALHDGGRMAGGSGMMQGMPMRRAPMPRDRMPHDQQ